MAKLGVAAKDTTTEGTNLSCFLYLWEVTVTLGNDIRKFQTKLTGESVLNHLRTHQIEQ